MSQQPLHHGNPQRYSDLAITTVLGIDYIGLKVFGDGEWKVKKHGKERRRTWRKPTMVRLLRHWLSRPEQNDEGGYARKRANFLKTQLDTERLT
ncbi:transposase, IS4 family [Escherichia coli p0305293.13]|nr:transposase, IS4 family [Escherichia coli p0305293.13]